MKTFIASLLALLAVTPQRTLDEFFNDFPPRWVRNNPNLAVSSRYTGDERDRLEQQLAPETMEYKKSRILMVGYGPPSTGFSLALKRIGDRLKARLGDEVDIKYVYNVLHLGYREDDLNWMVADGVLTLAYQSSGYFTPEVPDLGVADLPYLFPNVQAARAAIDGRFGQALAATLEAGLNCRVLGYFEAGFSQLSNALRPVHTPADMKGMRIRVRPSKVP